LISTGSKAIDALLGGGIRPGMITDVYGESGSGKTQLCFTLCANCVKEGGRVLFVDTAGTFRPERVAEISGSKNVLDKIALVRALTVGDQVSAIQKIPDTGNGLVVVDSLTSLFSAEYSGPSRHLAVMKHLRALGMSAINSDSAVVVTNMVRNVPSAIQDQGSRKMARAVVPSQQREYLGSSVSIYSHMKMKLEIIDPKQSLFRAILLQPPGKEPVEFGISALGISDASG
jgi:RecA/RadA recombinase